LPSWKIFAKEAKTDLAPNMQWTMSESLSLKFVQGVSELKLRSSLVSLLFSLAFAVSFSSRAEAAKVSSLITDQGDTVHLELSGQQNWEYDLRRAEKNGKSYLQLTVDAIDEASLKKILSFKSDMVSAVTVDKAGADGKYILNFQVSGDEVESFDYLTDQPSRLIVDFYANAQKTVKPVAVTALPAKVVKVPEPVAKAKTTKTRKPATADVLVVSQDGPNSHDSTPSRSGLFDGGDPTFEGVSNK
jgi:hypothetical protein